MCFSATASFVAAGGLAAVGAAALALKPPPRTLLFAAFPALFAVHQALEGFIWLQISAGEAVDPILKISWLLIAQVLWPILTPLAVLLMERGRRRRQGLAALLVAGVIVAGALLSIMLRHEYSVFIANGSLRYATDKAIEESITGLYLLATVAPLLLSRSRFVLLFGVSVLAGSFVTALMFAEAAKSVWCFFAAIASVFVFLHIRETRRRPRLMPMPGL